VSEQKSLNPLKAFMNIKREELALSLFMFAYFFVVISTFWIFKPIKKGLLIAFYRETPFELFSWTLKGSQAELIAKVMNMVVAYLAVLVFTMLARRYRRQQLTYIFSGFTIIACGLFTLTINSPGPYTVWSFYLFGDLYNTVMVATFFAFLNDSVRPEAARRLYGLIVLGGVAGGVFGVWGLRALIDHLDTVAWLVVCAALTVVVALLARLAGGRVEDEPEPASEAPEQKPPPDHPLKTTGAETPESKKSAPEPATKAAEEPSKPAGNPAIEGAKLVFRRRYLLAIVAVVGLYEIVSTVADFQFTATIEHYFPNDADFDRHMATVYGITNVAALVVQLFFTGFVMTRFRLSAALLILPVAILATSAAYLIIPALWIGSMLNTADNGLNYTINQSSKEALYTPTNRDEKYKAKAFIDMFVQRFAKAIAVGVSLTVTILFSDFSTIRWLSLFTAAIIIAWIFAARYAGRRFHELTD